MATLTNANSVFTLAVASVYPTPQLLQGYATDDAFTADDVAPVEVVMGVDGKLSGGYTPVPYVMTVMLQADSASCRIFDDWHAAQKAAKEVYTASGLIVLQGTQQKFAASKGFLTSYSPAPAAKKILQPRKFVITFEDISMSPV